MKQVFKYASLLFVAGTLLVTSCKKKSDDATTPVTIDETPSGNTVCVGNNKTKITIDASTDATQNSYNGKSYSCTVATGATDTLYVDIKSKKDMDYIFIKRISNGGSPDLYTNKSDLKTVDGTLDVLGSSTEYSYKVPAGDFISTALKVKIPAMVMTSNSTDVYVIWFTKEATVGSGKGDFTNTGNRTVVGPIYVTLKNGSASGIFKSQTTLTIGDQASPEASYITSGGGVNTLKGSSLLDSTTMTADERAMSLNGTDFNMASIAADGQSLGNGSTPYFISVGIRSRLGFTKNASGTNVTKFAKITAPSDFSSLTASQIGSLATPTLDRIKIESSSYYVYLTQDGRKGVIKTGVISSTSPYTITVNVVVQAGN